MKTNLLIAAVAALAVQGATAVDFTINLDPKAKPIKDQRQNDCGPSLGYNGGMTEFCDVRWVYQEYPDTLKVFREAGVRLMGSGGQKEWAQNLWVQKKLAEFRASGKKLEDLPPAEQKAIKAWMRWPDIKAVWDFWKQNGIKMFICLDCYGGAFADGKFVKDHALFTKQCLDYVQWIVDNGYKEVVAGFRLGNEPYWGGAKYKDHAIEYADYWKDALPGIKKIWPKAHIGVNIAEYFDNDPDIAAVRNRSLATEPHADNAYFAARTINQWSAQCILRMKELDILKYIDHIDYHGYGAETPYSGSYYGIQRFRKFMRAFPELDHIKKMWITEWRDRSDEANRCHQSFSSTLWKAHYCLTALAQPDIDGTSLHCIVALAGGLAVSDGKSWFDQWDSAYNGHTDMLGKPRLEVGPAGPLFRLYNEALMRHPIILAHGVGGVTEGEDRFFAGTRYYDSWVALRRSNETDPAKLPKIDGSVEWVAAMDPGARSIALLMVNTTDRAQSVRVNVKDRSAIQPLYRTFTCDQDKIYAMYVPGENPPWRTMAWEDTMGPGWFEDRVNGEWGPRRLDPLTIKIGPNTIQAVTIPIVARPKPKK